MINNDVLSTPANPSTGAGIGKPRTRQRIHKTAPQLDVPDIEQDATERKRVLNVLAQRRYRDRKRQERLKAQGKVVEEESQESPSTREGDSTLLGSVDEVHSMGVSAYGASPAQSHPSTEGGAALMDIELVDNANWDMFAGQDLPSLLQEATNAPLPDFSTGRTTGAIFNAFDFTNFRAPVPSSLSNSPLSFTSISGASDPNFDFPDSYLLPVHELTLLKGLMRICARLGCDNTTIWSIDCLSPFNIGTGTPAANLPTNWQPTASQISVPHHPVFDFLPWPSARDRILMFLALPDEARPPVARGPMCLVNFVYDLEDGHEGVRIYGDDPCDAKAWEIGQVLFERWWFLFDRQIVENSNRWRELRGAPPLLKHGE